MALEQLIQASKVQQITMVDNLPSANETEYNKHLLYQKDEDLYFIRSYLGEENISSLGEKLSYPVCGAAVGKYGDYVYILGGATNSWNEFVNTILKYNLATNTCITLSVKLPQKLAYMAYGQIGNKLYLMGGQKASSSYSNIIYCFDLETETIETISTTLPSGAAYQGFVVVGAKIYFTGGFNGNNINTLYCFDGETKLVSAKTSIINGNSTVLVSDGNNKIYCFEGKNVQVYDIDANTVTTLTEISYSLERSSGIYYNNEIILFGGGGSSGAIASYNPNTYILTKKNITLNSVVKSMGLISIDNEVWLFGGTPSLAGTNIVQKYNFPDTLYGYKKITSEIVS